MSRTAAAQSPLLVVRRSLWGPVTAFLKQQNSYPTSLSYTSYDYVSSSEAVENTADDDAFRRFRERVFVL